VVELQDGGATLMEKPLTCAFGTPWLAHFDPPIGTGEGCTACAEYEGATPAPKVKRSRKQKELANV